MNKPSINVRLTLTEPMLGTASGNRKIHEEFIASKATGSEAAEKAAEEAASIPLTEQIEKASTIYARDPATGRLHLWDYQIRGFLKESLFTLIETGDCNLSTWVHRRAIDKFVFVNPRRVFIKNEDGSYVTEHDGNLERPLRASTMQGDRVALARSEMVPVGCTMDIEIVWFEGYTKTVKKKGAEESKSSRLAVFNRDLITSMLDLGQFSGLGQWRNASYGRFTWVEIKKEESASKAA